jgi:hypothetical protein
MVSEAEPRHTTICYKFTKPINAFLNEMLTGGEKGADFTKAKTIFYRLLINCISFCMPSIP